ncbi:MAG: hydrogenase [Lentisphaeria bacterium]|nr:hydrogenase [Lentisphaeria bacterium]
MNTNIFLTLENGQSADAGMLAGVEFNTFRSAVTTAVKNGCRVLDLFAEKKDNSNIHKLICILGDPVRRCFKLLSTDVGSSYNALTPECGAFRWFERDIAERTGIIPSGFEDIKPLRFIRNSGIHPDAWKREEILPGDAVCKELGGSSAHEVAVGPVHAGVIEPGHFRFQCFGEEVHRLEIFLGYQHRNIEKLILSAPNNDFALKLIETVSGDSSCAYAWCFSQLLEALSGGVAVPPAGSALRIISTALERIANNTGTLGALAGDVAFLPTSSFCGRIRGEYLNLTAELAGNRFGRGYIVPGGVRYGIDREVTKKILDKMEKVDRELEHALKLMFDTPSVLDRFENLGTVSGEDAAFYGITGAAGRACGLKCDARHDFPPASGSIEPYITGTANAGSVLARAQIYQREALSATVEIKEILNSGIDLNSNYQSAPAADCQPNRIAVSVIEAWRGEVMQYAVTDENGKIKFFRCIDPSLHNWRALELAMRGTQISDFPICNKSFNLSYCGVDL